MHICPLLHTLNRRILPLFILCIFVPSCILSIAYSQSKSITTIYTMHMCPLQHTVNRRILPLYIFVLFCILAIESYYHRAFPLLHTFITIVTAHICILLHTYKQRMLSASMLQCVEFSTSCRGHPYEEQI